MRFRRCSPKAGPASWRAHEATVHNLHAKIGELTVERDFFGEDSSAESGGATADDRAGRPFESCEAVRVVGGEPVVALLPPEGGERGEPGAHAAHGRAAPGVSVLREPAADAAPAPRGHGCGTAPDPAAHGGHGAGGDLPAATHQRSGPGASDLPYRLRGLAISRADQVWCADITYVPVSRGFFYLVAVMDWATRHVLAWRLSNTMDATFCIEALDEALDHRVPEIFNTDQGSQFTSEAFADRVLGAGVNFSMDGRGRFLDNIFIERLWRSLKYEAVYLHELRDGLDASRIIGLWIDFYNDVRPHSALGGRTPGEAYRNRMGTM